MGLSACHLLATAARSPIQEPAPLESLGKPVYNCPRSEEGCALIRLILVGTLLLLALSFFLQNQEQEVTLRYFFGLHLLRS